MSTTFGDQDETATTEAPRPRGTRGQWMLVLPMIIITLFGGELMHAYYAFGLSRWPPWLIPTVFEALLAIFLAFLPPLICLVQNVTKRRQLSRLRGLSILPIQQTIFYQTALASANALEDATIGSVYSLPMLVYFITVLLAGVAFLIGFNSDDYFKIPNLLLSGLHTIVKPDDMVAYQRQTFVMVGVAFFASYSYSLGMLLTRINTSDLYPISLHYYAVRVVMACIAAAVLRHAFGMFDTNATMASMILTSFAIGFAPDLFILTAIRRGFQILKIWAVRDDPSAATRPDAMPLLMIDDLTRDKVDHLTDIGVDSVQVLARQNPVLLLTRLPYELALLVDWIAQAQVYVIVRDQGMQKLRARYVRDIFDFRLRLGDAVTGAALHEALGLSDEAAACLARQIDEDPTYLRLREVRTAMGKTM